MSYRSEALEIIAHAEGRLRELLAKAAEHADYDEAQVIAGLAREIRIVANCCRADEGSSNDAVMQNDPSPGNARSDARTYSTKKDGGPNRQALPSQPSRRRRTRAASREYPKFLREGESLVKIGWSKKGRSTYEHRAPRRVVDILVDSMTRIGVGGRRFVAEDLFPLRDPDGAAEIPSYQAYLSLAWLRAEGLVIQHGRQGYSLSPQADGQAVKTCWQALRAR